MCSTSAISKLDFVFETDENEKQLEAPAVPHIQASMPIFWAVRAVGEALNVRRRRCSIS